MPNACAEPVEELLHVLSYILDHFSSDFVSPGNFASFEFFDGFFDFSKIGGGSDLLSFQCVLWVVKFSFFGKL